MDTSHCPHFSPIPNLQVKESLVWQFGTVPRCDPLERLLSSHVDEVPPLLVEYFHSIVKLKIFGSSNWLLASNFWYFGPQKVKWTCTMSCGSTKDIFDKGVTYKVVVCWSSCHPDTLGPPCDSP